MPPEKYSNFTVSFFLELVIYLAWQTDQRSGLEYFVFFTKVARGSKCWPFWKNRVELLVGQKLPVYPISSMGLVYLPT